MKLGMMPLASVMVWEWISVGCKSLKVLMYASQKASIKVRLEYLLKALNYKCPPPEPQDDRSHHHGMMSLGMASYRLDLCLSLHCASPPTPSSSSSSNGSSSSNVSSTYAGVGGLGI